MIGIVAGVLKRVSLAAVASSAPLSCDVIAGLLVSGLGLQATWSLGISPFSGVAFFYLFSLFHHLEKESGNYHRYYYYHLLFFSFLPYSLTSFQFFSPLLSSISFMSGKSVSCSVTSSFVVVVVLNDRSNDPGIKRTQRDHTLLERCLRRHRGRG